MLLYINREWFKVCYAGYETGNERDIYVRILVQNWFKITSAEIVELFILQTKIFNEKWYYRIKLKTFTAKLKFRINSIFYRFLVSLVCGSVLCKTSCLYINYKCFVH